MAEIMEVDGVQVSRHRVAMQLQVKGEPEFYIRCHIAFWILAVVIRLASWICPFEIWLDVIQDRGQDG